MAKKKKNKDTSKLSLVRMNRRELSQLILDFFRSHPVSKYTLRQLFKSLHLTSHSLKMLCVDILEDLEANGFLNRTYEGEYCFMSPEQQLVEGIFSRKQKGRNFVDTDDDRHIVVYDENANHAMDGDRVRVGILAKKRGSSKMIGEVVEIVERSNKPIIGVLVVHKSFATLRTTEGAASQDVLIPADKLNGGKTGDKVVVGITEWPENSRNPFGEVLDVLGASGDNDAEMHAILAEYNLPYKYPAEVEAAAELLSADITPEEIAKREDFREVTTFTIDPKDAKDFDDALSIRPLNGGLWEVGVHIADVSHYVEEGSVIDKEGYSRATSVYLVDRTVPMLPERLCNFICSLRPDEEKLTYSVIFIMDEQAHVQDSRIVHTVIKSNRRFTYEEAQEILERNGEASDVEGATPVGREQRTGEYCEELITLNRMAHELRKRRMNAGAIDFDRTEVRFEIDENGKPLSVYFKHSKDANKLIEEFMLLANRTVAESVGKVRKGEKTKTLPYRVHDVPDPGKLENLGKFVAKFGLKLNTFGSKKEVAQQLNKLLVDVKGKKYQELVEEVSLRAMMKAKYSTINIGHYGLAFDFYTHFTSPIRRYPDLMVHRLLTKYALGGASADQEKYEDKCEHCSEMEQVAANAERASIKYKQVEFLSDKIGQEFDATISGVTEFGIYAEIDENKCEGLISVHFLGNETYEYDDRNYCLIGRKTHRTFSLGDHIRIKVAKANLERKQLDFDLVDVISGMEHQPPFYAPFQSGASRQPKGKESAQRGRRK